VVSLLEMLLGRCEVASFIGQLMFVQSYVVTGDANVKEFFLKSVGEYHALRSDRLAPLEALFFDKVNPRESKLTTYVVIHFFVPYEEAAVAAAEVRPSVLL
jgi:hypothetical protein